MTLVLPVTFGIETAVTVGFLIVVVLSSVIAAAVVAVPRAVIGLAVPLAATAAPAAVAER